MPQATREEQEKAERIANEINSNSRDKDRERVRQGRDAEARGDEIEEDEEQLFAAASSAVPANSANKEREAQRESRAPGVPTGRSSLGGGDDGRFRSSGGAGGGRRGGGGPKNNRDYRAPGPRDQQFERQRSNDSSHNQNWRLRDNQNQRGVSQPDANSNSLPSAQPNSLLVSQPPALPESPHIATLPPYTAQSPQNPSRRQFQQQNLHQQHLSPGNSHMTHTVNVHISATGGSPAARMLENAPSNGAPVAIPPLVDAVLPPPPPQPSAAVPQMGVNTMPPLITPEQQLAALQQNPLLLQHIAMLQQHHHHQQFQSPPSQQQILNSGAADNPTDLLSHMTPNTFAGQYRVAAPLVTTQLQTSIIPAAAPADTALNKSAESQETQIPNASSTLTAAPNNDSSPMPSGTTLVATSSSASVTGGGGSSSSEASKFRWNPNVDEFVPRGPATAPAPTPAHAAAPSADTISATSGEPLSTDSRPLARPPENLHMPTGVPAAAALVQGVAPALPLGAPLPPGAVLNSMNVNQLPAFQAFSSQPMSSPNFLIMSDPTQLQALVAQNAGVGVFPINLASMQTIDPNATPTVLLAPNAATSLQASQLMPASLQPHLIAFQQQLLQQQQQQQQQLLQQLPPQQLLAGHNAAHTSETQAMTRVNLDDSSSSLPTQRSGERDNRRSSSSTTQQHPLALSAISTRSTTPSVASQQVLLNSSGSGLPLPVASDVSKTVTQMQQQFVQLPQSLAHAQQPRFSAVATAAASLPPGFAFPPQMQYMQQMMGQNLVNAQMLHGAGGAYGVQLAHPQMGTLQRLPGMASFQQPLQFTQQQLFAMQPSAAALHSLQPAVPAQIGASAHFYL